MRDIVIFGGIMLLMVAAFVVAVASANCEVT